MTTELLTREELDAVMELVDNYIYHTVVRYNDGYDPNQEEVIVLKAVYEKLEKMAVDAWEALKKLE